MNRALLQENIQEFILQSLDADPHALALKKSPFKAVNMPEIAAQIAARKRIKSKLPSLFDKKGLLFPAQLNLEQSSSELTANYKAADLEGEHLLDLTGGLGIDSMAFARKFKEVCYSEHNETLAATAKHNFEQLGLKNIQVYAGNGLELLSQKHWDVIYCDPDRRTSAKRAFNLADCEPNVVELEQQLLANATLLIVKAAPLLDISAVQNELNELWRIEIIAVKGEVKELLLYCKADSNLQSLTAVNLTSDKTQVDQIHPGKAYKVSYSEPLSFLYLPHAALMKLQAFDYLSETYKVLKLAQHSHIFTADARLEFPGRTFAVKSLNHYSKQFMRSFKKQEYLIISRNFPLTVAELRQKWKIKDAGSQYLIFTTLQDGSRVVITAELVS